VTCDSEDVKKAIIIKVKETSQAYCSVLEHVLGVVTKAIEPAADNKAQLTELSKKVATSVADLVKESENLKGIINKYYQTRLLNIY